MQQGARELNSLIEQVSKKVVDKTINEKYLISRMAVIVNSFDADTNSASIIIPTDLKNPTTYKYPNRTGKKKLNSTVWSGGEIQTYGDKVYLVYQTNNISQGWLENNNSLNISEGGGSSGSDITDVILNKTTTDVVSYTGTPWPVSAGSVSYSGGSSKSVLGSSTTFALSNGAVTHGSLTGHTDEVLGTGTTFNVTNPTINVTPSQTYLGATASGTAVGADGTASVVTGYTPSTDTFVKSVSAETNKNLVTTTVPNVTNAGSASTWSFTLGTGDDSDMLIISGVNSTPATLGNAITVATGATSTTGTGDAVVTGVTVGSSASAITSLGTASTTNVLTGVKVTSQPTIALSSNASSGTGRVQVATGISSATATGGAVSASGDNVSAIISMPTSTVGTGISVGSNDPVTAITNIGTATVGSQTVSPSNTVNVLRDATLTVVREE